MLQKKTAEESRKIEGKRKKERVFSQQNWILQQIKREKYYCFRYALAKKHIQNSKKAHTKAHFTCFRNASEAEAQDSWEENTSKHASEMHF